MQEFTSIFNEKEIVFAKEGIRYDNKAYIKYDDMEDVTVNDGNLIFRYKGRLIRMEFNPEDTSKIEDIFVIPTEPTEDESPSYSEFNLDLDRFAYLNSGAQEEKKEEPPKEKKSKKGLIIGALVALAAVVVALIIIL